jgi:hypothetical protein
MRMLILICVLCIALFGCNKNSTGPELQSEPITATAKLSAIDSLAQSFNKGLRLMIVMSTEIDTNGASAVWQYAYTDNAASPSMYWFHASSDKVVHDSTSTPVFGVVIITHNWFNSDSALHIAERNGGSQFRSTNPNHIIGATLSQSPNIIVGPRVMYSATCWYIYYSSNDDYTKSLTVGIDASTGEVEFFGTD